MLNAGYQWRYGSPFKADANAFAEQLRSLADTEGAIDLQSVLDASRPSSAPLHGEIDWDDDSAALKHRLGVVRQAMGALRVIPVDIVREEALPPMRATVPVRMTVGREGGRVDNGVESNVYRLTVTQVTMDEYAATARAAAMGDIVRLANRLRSLPGCADLAEKLSAIAEIDFDLEVE